MSDTPPAPADRLRPGALFWVSVPLAAAVTWGVHELFHYLAGRVLGYPMWLSMNQVGIVDGDYASRGDKMTVAMAGPLVTYLQAACALWLIRSRRLDGLRSAVSDRLAGVGALPEGGPNRPQASQLAKYNLYKLYKK